MGKIETRLAYYRSIIARLVHSIRRSHDALMHPLRRRRAHNALQSHAAPASVLFLCLGNICRSPFAARAFERALPPGLRAKLKVISAGLIGPDRPTPPEGVTVASALGVNLSAHRSQLLTAEHLSGADLLVVMEPRQSLVLQRRFGVDERSILVLADLDPEPIEIRAILDPVEQPIEVFEACYRRIQRCTLELARALSRSSEPPRAE
jgi:protein-tyrosine phosphatase